MTLTTTTNMGSSTSLTNRWNDHINGAPVEDFFAGKESIRTRTGYDPNEMIFSGFATSTIRRMINSSLSWAMVPIPSTLCISMTLQFPRNEEAGEGL